MLMAATRKIASFYKSSVVSRIAWWAFTLSCSWGPLLSLVFSGMPI
jgi:hypothetical protein